MGKKLIDRLADCSEILELARLELDVRTQSCPTCGSKRFVNWTEAKAHKSLSAALSKIDSTISELYERKGGRHDE